MQAASTPAKFNKLEDVLVPAEVAAGASFQVMLQKSDRGKKVWKKTTLWNGSGARPAIQERHAEVVKGWRHEYRPDPLSRGAVLVVLLRQDLVSTG